MCIATVTEKTTINATCFALIKLALIKFAIYLIYNLIYLRYLIYLFNNID